MKVTKQYHQHTPDLIERLSGDLRACRRLGLTDWTLTSVAHDTDFAADPSSGVNYYFEATFPPNQEREENAPKPRVA